MTQLPHNLYRASQVRDMDKTAIEEHQISGTILMERAGSAAFELVQQLWPEAKTLSVFCGTGNNGGDGYVIARLAHEHQYNVKVYQLGDSNHIQGDALAALQRLEGAGLSTRQMAGSEDFSHTEVFVDALLGTGFEGKVQGEYQQAIDIMNQASANILAVDVPSGLNADTGHVAGTAVKADCTITFIGMKRGLLTADAADYCGQLRFDDLRIPQQIFEAQPAAAEILDYERLNHVLGKRARCAHKGEFGHVLIIGGDHGMSGAVRMAGEAAQRVGAGLVSIATRPEHAALLSVVRPELMCHGVTNPEQLKPLLEKTSVVAIGPGLGHSEWAEELKSEVMSSDLPMVVDADALNLLAREHFRRNNWVLTPHPGEAARLLKSGSQAIQADRFAAAQQLQDQFGGVVVLKGAGSLVQCHDYPTGICIDGNPGMASGGMGDVLSGVIAGLIAQGLSLPDAARLGVVMHARAADMSVTAVGERGLLATDLMVNLRRLANP
ncbi:MAG: NAD(P)H-hydrate dehydratase [Thioalkalispiraceae bacterium]|jgi:NAD(P)H-hydrate epimerase